VREHEWEEPGCDQKGQRGNLWKCRACGAVICWNGWPGDPKDDPHYETPPPPDGFNVFSSYLSGYPRDCDLALVRMLMEK
jgi:hypothetical protein